MIYLPTDCVHFLHLIQFATACYRPFCLPNTVLLWQTTSIESIELKTNIDFTPATVFSFSRLIHQRPVPSWNFQLKQSYHAADRTSKVDILHVFFLIRFIDVRKDAVRFFCAITFIWIHFISVVLSVWQDAKSSLLALDAQDFSLKCGCLNSSNWTFLDEEIPSKFQNASFRFLSLTTTSEPSARLLQVK